MSNLILFVYVCAALSILYAFVLMILALKKKRGEGEPEEICLAVQKASQAYLYRYYNVIALVGIVIFLILGFVGRNWTLALAFLVGALLSCIISFVGLSVSVRVNSRVLEAAKEGPREAFKLAVRVGMMNGLFVAGVGLLMIAVFYHLYTLNFVDSKALIGLFFGVGLVALLAQIGSGIFTKAADRGAEVSKKAINGFQKKDPRNPSVVADDLGDIVGGSLATIAGLLETFILVLGATILLSLSFFEGDSMASIYPMVLAGVAILATIIGSLFIRISQRASKKQLRPTFALFKGLLVASVLSALAFYPVSQWLMGDNGRYAFWQLYLCVLVGLGIMFLMLVTTLYYVSPSHGPVKKLIAASEDSVADNVISGITLSLSSVFWPAVIIIVGIVIAFNLAGVYGLVLVCLGLLSVAVIIIGMSSYGPIVDNVHDIAQMTQTKDEIKEGGVNPLDIAGNTFKAVTRVYALVAAGLTCLVLFIIYAQELISAGKYVLFQLDDLSIWAGLLIGAVLPYIFSSINIKAVGKTSKVIADEASKQLKKMVSGGGAAARPDYISCVELGVNASIKKMIVPALLPFVVLFVLWGFGWFVGGDVNLRLMGGALIGAIVSGIFMALAMVISGSAWNNTKKFIENGGAGKGSEAHSAALVGDSLGDVYKDTAGPAISSLIKTLSIVALLIIFLLVL